MNWRRKVLNRLGSRQEADCEASLSNNFGNDDSRKQTLALAKALLLSIFLRD